MAKKVTTKVARTFNLKDAGAAVKSPLKLRDWLDKNIPLFVGPRITSFDPLQTQRDAIITIRGSRFAASRADNQVAIGGANAPVLAASATELKVLVPRDAESGAVEVTTGGRMATAPHDFTLKGYPAAGSGEDGPPVYAEGAGEGAEGDANPIGTLKVLVVICQAKDLVPAAPATVRTTVDNRWRDVQTFYSQASYTRTDIQYDIVPGAAALDGNFTDFVTLADPVNNIISGQKKQNRGNRGQACAGQRLRPQSVHDAVQRGVHRWRRGARMGQCLDSDLHLCRCAAGERSESRRHQHLAQPDDQPSVDQRGFQLGALRARIRPQHRLGAD